MTDQKSPAAVRFMQMDADRFSKSVITAFRVGFAVFGVLAAVAGIALLVWPARTIEVVAVILGVYLLVAGVIRAITGLATPGMSGGSRALAVVLGILYAVGGFFMVRNQTLAGLTLAVFVGVCVGIMWIIEGVMALSVPSDGQKGRGWTIAFAILSIVAGVIVLFSPAWSSMVLMMFAGAALVVMAGFLIYRAFTFGKEQLAAQKH